MHQRNGMKNCRNRYKNRQEYDKLGIFIKRTKLDYLIYYVKNLHGNNNFIQIKFQIKQTFTCKHINKN